MDEIELKLHDMSSTLQPVDAYALVLEEVNGNRKLPVIIGSLEAKAIRIKMLNYKLPRPWTHDLFLSLTRELGVTLKKILIYKVEDGIYYSYLFFDNSLFSLFTFFEFFPFEKPFSKIGPLTFKFVFL